MTYICFKPIGYIHRKQRYSPPSKPRSWQELYDFDEMLRREKVEVVVYKEYAEALKGIEEYGYLWLIWVSHLSEKPSTLLVHPYGDPSRPIKGIFATRSPARPNNIMLSLVRNRGLVDGKLIVTGTEAFDGSPLLDIKPYAHGLDDPLGVP